MSIAITNARIIATRGIGCGGRFVSDHHVFNCPMSRTCKARPIVIEVVDD
jgi:hypothetical protein